ncbi:MAG: type III pantothenate kinase [Gemmatales bacterium]|nr:type III pantothenate kinase [Gemmatales bacterium]MDW7994529.1 type III pantothenate kinase [Gemmatales bacterium]
MSVLVDVGNSRMKWGLVRDHALTQVVSLPLPESPDVVPDSWTEHVLLWQLPRGTTWVLSGTNPPALLVLQNWLQTQGYRIWNVSNYREIPLRVEVDVPERVGIDRLLNALAAIHRGPAGQPKLIVDIGSAVTVDWVNPEDTFCGGAIFPGFRLMSEALHRYTARLPLVSPVQNLPSLPAKNTESAIQAGMLAAIVGAVNWLLPKYLQGGTTWQPGLNEYSSSTADAPFEKMPSSPALKPVFYLTGGDAWLIRSYLNPDFIFWPEMTLEGLYLVAKSHSIE